MKAATLLPERAEAVAVAVPVPVQAPAKAARGRLADYLALTKPRIAVLVLFTVGAGVLLASAPVIPWAILAHAVLGTALVAAGASALNQWLEKSSDARMRRTQTRPLPAGRLSSAEVLAFGALLGVGGFVYLLLTLRSPLPAMLAALTFVLYVAVYTPLKRYTSLNTLVGAVPGAMPPLIGWSAVNGEITAGALALFAIVFVWQVPHFLAIAWIYRDEYARARMRMLPVTDPDGRATGRQMILYCLALIPVSLAPAMLQSAGLVYVTGAAVLGLGFLGKAWRFTSSRTPGSARGVLRASLVYLPGLLLVLLFDRGLYSLLGWR
jgi:protoheme IX farnesyltransferase